MQHTVFTNPDGIIEVHFVGQLSLTDNLEIGKQALSLTTAIIDQGKSPKILADFSQFSGPNPLTNRLNIAIIKDLESVKIAGYGASDQVAANVAQIAAATNTTDRIRLFATRNEAENWLNS